MLSMGFPSLFIRSRLFDKVESILMRLEANGAKIETKHKGQVLTVDLGDDTIEMSAWRNPNGGKFAPFNVQFDGVVGK